jgi:hypothetical protein
MATAEAALDDHSQLPDRLSRYFDEDLSRPLPFVLLGLVYFLLRLPFIGYGHGTDPDAWRVALTAHHLLESGDYFPSRLPGNPLHELVTTVFIAGGWVATDLSTAAVSLLGVFIFAKLLNYYALPSRALLTVGFAFTPLLFINSIATMDYMWALTCLLGAYYAVLRGWPVWAGVCLGLAIGFRLQSFVFLPAFAFLIWRQADARQIVPFTLAATGTAALAFAPVLVAYGIDFATFYDSSVYYQDVIRLVGKEALGVLGGLGVIAGVILSLQRLKSLPSDALKDAGVAFWLLAIGTSVVSFLRLPHEIAYLIPVFPFGIMIMGRYFTRLALTGAITAILLAGVVDITTPGDEFNLDSFTTAEIGRGLILSNADTMRIQREFSEDVLSAEVPNHSLVMTGFIFPQFAVREWDELDFNVLEHDYDAISLLSDRGESVDAARDVRYVWLLTYDSFLALRSEGYSFFLVPDAAGGTAALYDYRPTLFGATFLALDRAAPSAGKGTASTDR